MDKPGMVTLLGKDGTRMLANLLRENSGRMSLGKGLKDFARANGLNMGESFTLELIWENATPVLSLLSTEFRSQNRFVTLTLTQDSFKNSRLVSSSINSCSRRLVSSVTCSILIGSNLFSGSSIAIHEGKRHERTWNDSSAGKRCT